MRLPIGKLLNIVFTWAAQRVDPEKRQQWEMDLDNPLPWQAAKPPTAEELEREGEAFMALMMSNGG